MPLEKKKTSFSFLLIIYTVNQFLSQDRMVSAIKFLNLFFQIIQYLTQPLSALDNDKCPLHSQKYLFQYTSIIGTSSVHQGNYNDIGEVKQFVIRALWTS